MNAPSQFQNAFPLSRNKFLKKMIGAIPKAFAFSIISAIPLSLIFSFFSFANDINIANNFGNVLIGAVIVFFVLAVLFYMIYGVYVGAYIRRYYYDASEQFLTIQKRVFSPTEIHVPYQKIQDVYVDQDILDRMMGLYDVHIASATVTSGIEAHIDGVDADVAEKLKNFLLGKIQYGSTPSAAASVAAAPIPEPPAAGVFTSQNYPISATWLVGAVVMNFLSTTFIVLLIAASSKWALFSYMWLWIGLYLVIFIANTIRVVLWRITYSFEFQPQFILVRQGVLRREEKHVPYRSVQNVLNKQSIIDRMFGLGTVVIENAAQGAVVSRRGAMSRPSQVIIPGQPTQKAKQLSDELNRILGGNNASTTGL
jgi:putative membrane protein